jgi:outer membrane protein, multidrug efflux system
MNLTLPILVATLLALAAGGCTLAPEYQRPELPVADTLPMPQSQAKTGVPSQAALSDIAGLGWRDFFADPVLQELLQSALTHNRDLRETALTVAAYQAQYRIQRSALFPGISGEAAGSKQRTFSGDNHSTIELYSASVGITAYELDLFGRVRNLKDQALAQYLAMEETHRSTRISLVAEVARAYLTWLTDLELLAITEDTHRIEEESFQLIEQRTQEGLATQMELAQARTGLETARANMAMFRRLVAQDSNHLVLLTGRTPPADPEQTLTLIGQIRETALPAYLSSHVLLQRPDIQAAEHELQGAHASIGAARAAFYPAISLTAAAGVISGELSDLFDGGAGAWMFAPKLTLPIFTGGRLAAQLDVAEIRKDISVARYEKVIQQAFREAADALVAAEGYREQMIAQQANLAANQDYYTLARDRYHQGLDSFLTLLDAQRSLYIARKNLLSLQLAEETNRVNLYKALGGGWKEWSQTPQMAEGPK